MPSTGEVAAADRRSAYDKTRIRAAVEADAAQIREVYLATYGTEYAYPQFYDIERIKKAIFADDNILLVGEDVDTGQILGTATVVLEVGAFADLVGEFGRLAVHPDARNRGLGRRLMQERLDRVKDRLHVGIVDNRVAHPYSQRISEKFGFTPVGYIPKRLLMGERESTAFFVQYFSDALTLRRNHPRVISEIDALAEIALGNCGIRHDVIIDDVAPPYPHDNGFKADELTPNGYATLLRFQRGRVHHREICGPLKLHYGLFNIKASASSYLLARDGERIVGAVGFTIDHAERTVRVFELLSVNEQPIRFLLQQLVERCRSAWSIEYIEADVNAFATRMQRTLLELNFLPVAYAPAVVFHEVERLDCVKMSQLLVPYAPECPELIESVQSIAEIVIARFEVQAANAQIAEAASSVRLFDGLTSEQVERVAAACSIETFDGGTTVFKENHHDGKTYVVLRGQVAVTFGESDTHVGEVGPGECVGEMSLLRTKPHSATVTAVDAAEMAVLSREASQQLVRQRPDIGLVLYRNLAKGLGEKLQRSDERLARGD